MATNLLLAFIAVLIVVNLAILVRLITRKDTDHAEQTVRSELREGRDEAAKRSHELRE